MTNKRSPAAKARDEWLDSEEGNKALNAADIPGVMMIAAATYHLRNPPPPIPDGEFCVTVEVDGMSAWITDAPEGLCRRWLDEVGYDCEDACLDHWPKEDGIWLNETAEFWHHPGDPYGISPSEPETGIDVDPDKWVSLGVPIFTGRTKV